MTGIDVKPQEIRVAGGGKLLRVLFAGVPTIELEAELLRVESPSAEVKGHGPGEEQLVWGKRTVRITGAEPVGNYAIRLIFSDGHSTGLFTWEYLARLGRDHDRIWQDYLSRLAAAGRGRD